MNRIGLFATLAALIATSAYAAQSYDPAVPQGLSGQRVEPAGELATPASGTAPPRLVQNQRRSQRDADARRCLDQANNKSIHRCSLPYRSHASGGGASVKKASAKAPAAPAPAPIAEVAKPADTLKPGAPKPGDAAKAAEIVKPMDVTKSAAAPKPAEAAKPAAPPPPPPTAPAKPAEPAKK